ncbi:MAG: pyroglutamyl-peptidase I [Clostridiales bacterium]|nr:pyroglutamyl-peptidase I [Clostridiales bacterium]
MKTILLTGFAPFGADAVNPSWEALTLLPDQAEGVRLVRRRLPVAYDQVAGLLARAVEEVCPDAVLCVGQAGGRTGLTPELAALNWKDAALPDNAGVSYGGVPICPEGPAAYFATVPVKEMVAAIRAAGVPAALSCSAGTYVCNCTMYHLLRLLEARYPAVQGGFLHVPYASEQVLDRPAAPSLPLPLIAAGIQAAALAIARGPTAGERHP